MKILLIVLLTVLFLSVFSLNLAANPKTTLSSNTIEIYKNDGTAQCGMGKEIPLKVMEKELTNAGIKVIERSKGSVGLYHIALCGAPTGIVNVYKIPLKDLKKAQKLGFKVYKSLVEEIINTIHTHKKK